jgi:hypothetical protein
MFARGCALLILSLIAFIGLDLLPELIRFSPYYPPLPPLWTYFIIHSVLLIAAILCAFPPPAPDDQQDPASFSRTVAPIALAINLADYFIYFISTTGSLIHPSDFTLTVLHDLGLLGLFTGMLALIHLLQIRARQLSLPRLIPQLKLAFTIYLISDLIFICLHISRELIPPRTGLHTTLSTLRNSLSPGLDLAFAATWILLASASWSLFRALRRPSTSTSPEN